MRPFFWLGSGALALLVGCQPPADDPDADLPFPGARELELPCLENRAPPSAAEVDQIVAALQEVYGAYGRARSLQIREDLYVTVPGDQSNHADKRVYFRADRRVRVDAEFPSGLEQKILDGEDCYLTARGAEPQPARGALSDHVLVDFKVLMLPRILGDPAYPLSAEAPQEIEGRWLIPLRVAGESPELVVWVNPRGPVIERVEADLALQIMVKAERMIDHRTLVFSDFRAGPDGVWPYRQVIYSEDKYVALSEVIELIRDLDLPDALFTP